MGYEMKFVGVLRFKARTPLHVGGAREANVLFTLKLRSGQLLVPASTWKGAFRAVSEKLARTMPMSPLERLAVERESLLRGPAGEELLQRFRAALAGREEAPFNPLEVRGALLSIGYSDEELASLEDPRAALLEYLAYSCPLGRLYGNQVLAGRVRFLDTLLTVHLERRPGVGIDRKTLRSSDRFLYQVETTPADIDVPLVMVGEVEKLGSTPSRLLASTLEAVQEVGLSIGGKKSAGLGLLELESARFHVVKPLEDRGGRGLANPLKLPPLQLEGFLGLLRGEQP